jgi:hypothetical protein
MGIKNFDNCQLGNSMSYDARKDIKAKYIYFDITGLYHQIDDVFYNDCLYGNLTANGIKTKLKYDYMPALEEYSSVHKLSAGDCDIYKLMKDKSNYPKTGLIKMALLVKEIYTLIRDVMTIDNADIYVGYAFDGNPTKAKLKEKIQRKFLRGLQSEIRKQLRVKVLEKVGHGDTSDDIWNKNIIDSYNQTSEMYTYWNEHKELHNIGIDIIMQHVRDIIKAKHNKNTLFEQLIGNGEGEILIHDKIMASQFEKGSNVMIFSPDSDVKVLSWLEYAHHKDNSNIYVMTKKYGTLKIYDTKEKYDIMVSAVKGDDTQKLNVIYDNICLLTLFGNDFLPGNIILNINVHYENIIRIYTEMCILGGNKLIIMKNMATKEYIVNIKILHAILHNLLTEGTNSEEDDIIMSGFALGRDSYYIKKYSRTQVVGFRVFETNFRKLISDIKRVNAQLITGASKKQLSRQQHISDDDLRTLLSQMDTPYPEEIKPGRISFTIGDGIKKHPPKKSTVRESSQMNALTTQIRQISKSVTTELKYYLQNTRYINPSGKPINEFDIVTLLLSDSKRIEHNFFKNNTRKDIVATLSHNDYYINKLPYMPLNHDVIISEMDIELELYKGLYFEYGRVMDNRSIGSNIPLCSPECIIGHKERYRKRYYGDDQSGYVISSQYMEGILWNLEYYIRGRFRNGKTSTWVYSPSYSPLLSDFVYALEKLSSNEVEQTKLYENVNHSEIDFGAYDYNTNDKEKAFIDSTILKLHGEGIKGIATDIITKANAADGTVPYIDCLGAETVSRCIIQFML